MFVELVAAASRENGVRAWARVENAACARRLSAIADMLERQLAANGSADREQWIIDNWDAVAAEVAAAQNVSLGVASHQLSLAEALRDRLPRVAEVFAAGAVSLRLVNVIVYRTALITDREAGAKVDVEIAAAVRDWGSLSVAKLEAAIDYWVDRFDPHALRRIETSVRSRYVELRPSGGADGVVHLEGTLLAHDGQALDQRLDAMAGAVCEHDPRTLEQRRADALGALAHGGERLRCECGDPDCAAAGQVPSAVVVHVVADHESLDDDSAVQLDGHAPAGPTGAELRSMTPAEALAQPEPTGTAATKPASVMGGGLLPAPLLAAKIAVGAKIVPIVHPGQRPPEPRYVPSAALATFIRCRDLTCRFPGCDEPAQYCDVDHTIAYPVGPTQASNLKCLCRKHHLHKTFGGWRDDQSPDGTVVWRSPEGHTYTTHPGSRLLFPALCRPTAPITPTGTPKANAARTLKMLRRSQTRTQARAQRTTALRRLNDDYVTERNKPPPF
jgi:hypothetical protein